MRFTAPYRQLNKLLEDETLEPRLSWGLRMAVAASAPLLWGLLTNNLLHASWLILTAECICWVELKGAFTQRISILLTGVFLTFSFAALGTLTAHYLWISVIAVFAVCYIAGLFKNLGDRGSGLAICVYVMFIVSNAYPVESNRQLLNRLTLIFIGGVWTFTVGTIGSLFIPLRQPYRRSIALIWKANASLLGTINKGWDSKNVWNSIHDIYLQEKQVRTTMDSSLQLFENRSYQSDIFPAKEVELAKLRKLTSLVGIHIMAVSNELDSLKRMSLPATLKLELFQLLEALQSVVNKMAFYTASLKPEAELVVQSSIDKTHQYIARLTEYYDKHEAYENPLKRIAQLTERCIRLIENGLTHLQEIAGDKPAYSSYAFLKVFYVLQPQRWFKGTRLLWSSNTLTLRYILRSSLAASLALFFYKWFKIDHGYWFAFTVILVMQPYFGATLKKAFERITGTLAGGIVGGVFIHLNDLFYSREILLFISFVSMVYYVRKNYTIAAFFITVSLVLLFDAEQSIHYNIIIMRALCTIGGACLGIIAGFAFLPDWDSKWLPQHIAIAVENNYHYFTESFIKTPTADWTKWKRLAETANSSAFDSFNRYLAEPSLRKRPVLTLYHLIIHNVHITRDLNTIHIENETTGNTEITSKEQELLLQTCLDEYNEIMTFLKKINERRTYPLQHKIETPVQSLSVHQLFYLSKILDELKSVRQNLSQLIALISEKQL